ncbi:MAG TPA: hypothetical protein VGJ20_31650 [Xanthobacteraceae bacterium]
MIIERPAHPHHFLDIADARLTGAVPDEIIEFFNHRGWAAKVGLDAFIAVALQK